MEKHKNPTIGPLVSFRMFQKFMKDPCMIKLRPYDLLIAKLNANGFDQEALKLTHTYLMDHKKWVLPIGRN